MASVAKVIIGLLVFVLGCLWYAGALYIPGVSGSQKPGPEATTTLMFRNIETLYSKDSRHVYYKGNPVGRSDPATFKIIGRPRVTTTPDDYYARDFLHVYYNGIYIKYADPDTFVFFIDKDRNPTDYAKDKERVYDTYLGNVVKGADAESFVALNYWYGKDKNYVYGPSPGVTDDTGRFPIKVADPQTFTVVADPAFCAGDCTFDAQDKNHKYLRSQVVE